MIKCDKGHTQIKGSRAEVLTDLSLLVGTIIECEVEIGMDNAAAEAVVDDAVRIGKKLAVENEKKDSAGEDKKPDQSIDEILEVLADKIVKDMLGD